MDPISVVLIDDHAVLRHGLRSLLERESGIVVVGEAADGSTALAVVAQVTPHVLVVDLMMPGMSGLELIRQVRTRTPQTQVLVLSMYADMPYVREALRAGAVAYVLKEAPAAEFVHAVRETAQGRRYFSQTLQADILDSAFTQIGTAITDPYDLLSASERAVLALAARGATSAAIAKQLALSLRTVETYRANVLHKLDLRNQTEVVRYALKRGIIPLE